ncbi:MAG: hypothetical protein H0T51_07720 [Pirellulales bacterium]|nr:hypothetical protein [Pirellulales bacterium]
MNELTAAQLRRHRRGWIVLCWMIGLSVLCCLFGAGARGADIRDFHGRAFDPTFDNSPILQKMLEAGVAIEGDGDYWCLSPVDASGVPKDRLHIEGPVNQYATQHQEEGDYPGGLRFRVKLADDSQTWLKWHDAGGRRLGNIHLEDFTVRVEGPGSGIEIGAPGKGGQGISARGVFLSGVYLSAPQQLHAKPINDDGTLDVRETFGLRMNHCYSVLVPSLAARGFGVGLDLVHCDMPQVLAYHQMHSCVGLRHRSTGWSAVPGDYNVISEACRFAVIADSGRFKLSCEEGYHNHGQQGSFPLPAGARWKIAQGGDRIELKDARKYLRPGWPVRLDLETDRYLVIRDVGEHHATFYEAENCCFNGRELSGDGKTLLRPLGVQYVGINSRCAMSCPPRLEFNQSIEGVPLAVIVPGSEPIQLFGNVNERGLMDETNAYVIAANCAGGLHRFGAVSCFGRWCAPDHPLAFVSGAPTSGLNNLCPDASWGAGPAACYDDDGESRVEFRKREQWVRRLADHKYGWRLPVDGSVEVDRLRYRVLLHAEHATTLGLAAGPMPLGGAPQVQQKLAKGWQVIEGTIKAGRKATANDRVCLRMFAVDGVDVSRVEVTK